MPYYLLLSVSTIIILVLGFLIFRKTREPGYLIGLAVLYYWSLAGAWIFVYDQQNHEITKKWGTHFHYLFEKMFTVSLDGHYLFALSAYSVFIIVVELVILKVSRKKEDFPADLNSPLITISDGKVIAFSCLAIFFSTLIIWKEILFAYKFEDSIYTVTRTHYNRFFSIHQLLNIVSVAPLFIGFLTHISHKPQYLRSGNQKWLTALYIIVIILTEAYLTAIGNKREILFSGLLGTVFYLKNNNNAIRIKSFSVFVFIFIIPLVFNDTLRSFSPNEMLNSLLKTTEIKLESKKQEPETIENSLSEFANHSMSSFLFSNEMFCAQFSMYGVQKFNVQPKPFISVKSLAASMIPRAIKQDRPGDSYSYYAEQVHARKGQGYTIHHATAWYLNFGFAGIIAGAILIGWLWSYANQKLQEKNAVRLRSPAFRLMLLMITCAFAAHMPSIIRSGPEVYKSFVFEAVLLNGLFLLMCSDVLSGLIKSIGWFRKN